MEPTELQTRIEGEVLEVEWDALRPHAEREAVVLIGPEVPLVKAAMAVTLDLKDDVAKWMSDGHIAKISAADAADWPNDERYRFVIVQPFVLVQRIVPTSE